MGMQECKEDVKLNANSNSNVTSVDDKYKTLFEQVNAAAFLTTFEGQILEANHKSCDLLGYAWNEIWKINRI